MSLERGVPELIGLHRTALQVRYRNTVSPLTAQLRAVAMPPTSRYVANLHGPEDASDTLPTINKAVTLRISHRKRIRRERLPEVISGFFPKTA